MWIDFSSLYSCSYSSPFSRSHYTEIVWTWLSQNQDQTHRNQESATEPKQWWQSTKYSDKQINYEHHKTSCKSQKKFALIVTIIDIHTLILDACMSQKESSNQFIYNEGIKSKSHCHNITRMQQKMQSTCSEIRFLLWSVNVTTSLMMKSTSNWYHQIWVFLTIVAITNAL